MATHERRLKLFWWMMRRLVSLRYKVTVNGLNELGKFDGPTVILPNHPAYIDPMIVQSYLQFAGTSRPLVWTDTFHRWFLRPLMRVVRAVEVPDLSRRNRDAYRTTVTLIRNVVSGINNGESYLIYPSGRLQRDNSEFLGGARAASEIISRCPELKIVLVRIDGLWGSMFSCAKTGELPNLGRTVLKALGWLAAGGFFFVPRRPVNVSVELFDSTSFSGLDRHALNRFLEDWYNSPGPNHPRFVRYHWIFGPKAADFSVAS